MTTTVEQEEYILNIVSEFARDLSIAFPEYAHLWKKWETVPTVDTEKEYLMNYLRKVYLARFFDVLYQNDSLFNESTVDVHFFPEVDFRVLFTCEGVSDSTKQSIWKYLQLITFALLKCDGKDGDTNINDFFNGDEFKNLNEEELKSKISEAMESMRGFFTAATGEEGEDDDDDDSSEGEDDDTGKEKKERSEIPGFHPGKFFKNMFGGKGGMFEKMFSGLGQGGNPQEILDRLKDMMNGKIGKLATELMEEAAEDFKETFGDDAEFTDMKSMPDMAKKILKDPSKIMPLVSKLQAKVEAKMKSGDISREELQKEAEEMMSKMGMDSSSMQEMAQMMMKQMGGLGKGARVDTNAMNQQFKKNSMREKMRERYERRKAAEALAALQKQQNLQNNVFTMGGEKQEKSKAEPAWDLDSIVAEIEGTGAVPQKQQQQKKKKGKK
jgi:hypothetical protein